LCADDGKKAVLVGAADEAIGFLKQLQPDIIQDIRELTSGTTCCLLSKEKKASSIGIVDCLVRAETTDWQTDTSDFLHRNGKKLTDIDAVFVSQPEDVKLFDHAVCYIDYTGLYYSASAFAVHMAYDKLKHTDAKTALIINRICGNQLGAVLLQKDEAPN
jgi:hypothetical protein